MKNGLDADVVVIGSGISGLVAALRSQLSGLRTIVVEKSQRAGGLCGTFLFEGHEFAFGCNDFGTGFEKELLELGVEVTFHRPRAEFNFGARRLQLPPNAATLWRLALRPWALNRLIRGAKRASTLGELIDQHIDDDLLKDVASLPAFALMRSPDDVSLRLLGRELSKELGYGYDNSRTPIGGPSALIGQMVKRLLALGGALRLGSEVLEIRRQDGRFSVETSAGALGCRHVLTSQGRWDAFPEGSKPGLSVAAALLVVDTGAFTLPKNVHTLDWFEPGLAQMLRDLDRGVLVARPSFHAFCSDIPPRDQRRSITAFVPLSRGEQALTADRRASLLDHVCERLNALYPGFKDGLVGCCLLSPDEVLERTGALLVPSPLVPPVAFDKPASYDARTGLYHVGTSVGPPGDHAGAAALSGKLAAQQVIAACAGA
ncbi:MAG TPA: FAD-dependent oxidoreductase [Polyangiaceae bacterium]|nr:FAD-dependent oxidoreductase [Polyangiaceae bacterium]